MDKTDDDSDLYRTVTSTEESGNIKALTSNPVDFYP